MTLCACGCGEAVTGGQGAPRRFVSGAHRERLKRRQAKEAAEEQGQRVSEALRAAELALTAPMTEEQRQAGLAKVRELQAEMGGMFRVPADG